MLKMLKSNIYDLPTNSSLNYYWCSGFVLSAYIVIQIITGILLSLLYVADQHLSFFCVMELTKESLYGWIIRYFHVWGASMIFFVMFIHMLRALYYGSYFKVQVWSVGFILYLMMMVEAFLGYMLPWHQMSFWAATVLTGVVESVPFIGSTLYSYMVGGFGVTKITLVRMFGAHIVMAFLMLGLILLHLFFLHSNGSSNSLSLMKGYSDSVYFHHYYSMKDLFCVISSFTIFFMFMMTNPDFVLDSEAYLIADPMVTPVKMKPEWYFLFYYAMLRSVSSKMGGLILVISFIFLLWVPTLNFGSLYSFTRQLMFWLFVKVMVILSYLGACHPEWPYDMMSLILSLMSIVLLILYKFMC